MPDLATLFPAMPLVHAGTGVSDINHIINIILVLLIAIDIHELGHAVVADKLGDDTPRLAGHLSLNPFRHMDQFGILLLFLSAISGRGFTYGFTPINERKLRQRTEFGPAIVSVAGPLMNLILAAVVAIPLIHAGQMDTSFGFPLTAVGNNVQVSDFLSQLVYVNCFLAVFNLIPIPPLDGWAIVSSLLPPKVRFDLRPLVQYGPFILLLLIIFEPQVHFFSSVVDPMTSWVLEKLGGA